MLVGAARFTRGDRLPSGNTWEDTCIYMDVYVPKVSREKERERKGRRDGMRSKDQRRTETNESKEMKTENGRRDYSVAKFTFRCSGMRQEQLS